MKQTFIILTIFFLGCSGRQNSGQDKTVKSDTIKIESKSVGFDSIINRACLHQDLSYNYDYKIKSERLVNFNGINDSCTVQVIVFDKKTHLKIDSLGLTSIYYYGDVFQDCNNVRSYITGKNETQRSMDNDYGEFIIVDINFDSKEDLAIINDSGGNGGTFYSFYVQDNNKKFHLDKFLTDSMVYFPSKINKKNKTIVTYVHAGVGGLGEHIYAYNDKTKLWKEISHKYIDITKE
ncbi:MAG: hypothetical protein WCQ95_06685 [Bacteroidota bacterium]